MYFRSSCREWADRRERIANRYVATTRLMDLTFVRFGLPLPKRSPERFLT